MAESSNTAKHPSLEDRRFAPTEISQAHMRFFREGLSAMQKEIPQVRGLGFFGGRTLGKEDTEGDKPSDLDMVIFYDSTTWRQGKPSVELPWNIKERYRQIMQERGLPEYDTQTVFPVDISPLVTDMNIEDFVHAINFRTRERTEQLTMTTPLPSEVQNLLCRFFLVVGDDVLRNRDYILSQFETMDNGEYYFQALMQYLQHAERMVAAKKRPDIPPFRHYPQTLSEARNYFQIKSAQR